MVDTQARPADVNDVPTTAAVVPREPVAVRIPQAGLTPEKKARLVSLQNLCKQGTFTPAECAAKNAAILRGDP
jgi:hypothetical protein